MRYWGILLILFLVVGCIGLETEPRDDLKCTGESPINTEWPPERGPLFALRYLYFNGTLSGRSIEKYEGYPEKNKPSGTYSVEVLTSENEVLYGINFHDPALRTVSVIPPKDYYDSGGTIPLPENATWRTQPAAPSPEPFVLILPYFEDATTIIICGPDNEVELYVDIELYQGPDSDGDYVVDALDNCPYIPNRNQEDCDVDGLEE